MNVIHINWVKKQQYGAETEHGGWKLKDERKKIQNKIINNKNVGWQYNSLKKKKSV